MKTNLGKKTLFPREFLTLNTVREKANAAKAI
jgi:hypothetical protein